MNGYLLSVNGEYVPAGQMVIPVPNGEVRVYPMPNIDGGYTRNSQVTLGLTQKSVATRSRGAASIPAGIP